MASSTVTNRTVQLGSCAAPADGISAKPSIGAGKDWTSGDVIENLYNNPSTVKGRILLPSGATDAATTCA